MYGMVDKEYVRKKHFVDGWSIRRLSTQLKIARQTVRKLLADAEIPAYTRQLERACPVMDPYRRVIEEWLEGDKTAPAKQRHTAARIYERLMEEYGFTGGESTVRHYMRKLRATQSECFLKLEADPGEQMQIDFGHAEVDLNGERTKVCLFCMRFKYSLVPFVIAFPTERLEAFLEGHVRGFSYFGGVPREGLYDNASTQVVKVLTGPEREEVSVPGNKSGIGRADMVLDNNGVREVYEIKNITYAKPRHVNMREQKLKNKEALAQLERYIEGFNSEGYFAEAGTTFDPEGMVISIPGYSDQIVVLHTYGSDPGMIYYEIKDKPSNIGSVGSESCGG